MSANEPDYEAIIEAREEERGERWLHRMDKQYGRVEDYRSGPSRRCLCGKTWGAGQVEHNCRLLRDPGQR